MVSEEPYIHNWERQSSLFLKRGKLQVKECLWDWFVFSSINSYILTQKNKEKEIDQKVGILNLIHLPLSILGTVL